jgi:hypothetical protein
VQDLIQAVEDCGFEAVEAKAASADESEVTFCIPTLRNRQDAELIQAKLLKLCVATLLIPAPVMDLHEPGLCSLFSSPSA